jgi:hypothetical protein
MAGKRAYRDTRKCFWPLSQECEHCDGEHGPMVRNDELRGFVCPWCDDAYDAMEAEMAQPGDAYCDQEMP